MLKFQNNLASSACHPAPYVSCSYKLMRNYIQKKFILADLFLGAVVKINLLSNFISVFISSVLTDN